MRRFIIRLALVAAAACLFRAARADDAPGEKRAAGVLTFTNGDRLPGVLHEFSHEGEVAWQSPAFVEPLRFDASLLYLNEISFDVPAAAAGQNQTYLLTMTNGDAIYGDLESLGTEHLVFRSSQAGRLRLKRSAVHRLERCDSASILYAGPNSAAEWHRFPQPDSWRETEDGLAAYLSQAALRLDLELPPQAVFEIELSWGVAPDFELLLGAGPHAASWPACRLECVDGALIVRRETENEVDLEKVMDLRPALGRLHLLVLLDQARRRVDVFSEEGTPLATVKTEKDEPHVLSNIFLKHRSGRLKLERLRVSRSSGAQPAEVLGNAPRLQRSDGTLLYGKLIGYDAERREFRIAEGKNEQTCSADQADSIIITPRSESESPDAKQPANLVQCADGTRLSGWVDKLDGDRLFLDCLGAVDADTLEAVAIPLNSVRKVSFRRKVAPPTRTASEFLLLELDDGQIHGSLASAGEGRSGLGWKPLGSEHSSALREDASGRIDFPARSLPSKLRLDERDGDKLYLRAGDVLRCEVLSIDPAGVICQAAGAPLEKLSHDKLKAVELGVQSNDKPLPDDKRHRLLTLPRFLKDDPPTHILASTDGDYLRGRLLELTDDKLRFDVNGREREFARRLVSRIIWLHADELDAAAEAPPQTALPKGCVQVVRIDGTRVSFAPQEVKDGWISGVNPLLGSFRVHVDQESELLIGNRVLQRAAQSTYGGWKLTNAAEPLASRMDRSDATGAEQAGVGSLLIGRPAPDFDLELLSGDRFSLSALKGKVVVLDFWASWCAPCMQSLPNVAEAMAAFPAEQAEFAAVNLQQTRAEIEDALRRLKLSIPVVLDRDGKAAEKYGATSIPYTIVIGRDGNVSHVFVGSGPRLQENLQAAVRSHLPSTEQTKTDGE